MFDDFEDTDETEYAADTDTAAASGGLLPPRDNPDITGADGIESALLSLYNQNTMPHALIFAGPMGVGKCTMAFRVTRFLLAHSKSSSLGEDLGEGMVLFDEPGLFGEEKPLTSKGDGATSMFVSPDDPVFRRVASGGHPDLRYIQRTEKKNVIDVETVREIAPFLRKTTAEGGWRIVIVDEAERMHWQSQNAILKILEEPPPRALLILVCNRLGAMLPTIRSRCRTYHFAPLPDDLMKTLMARALPKTSTADLAMLTALADGSIGRALMLEQEEGANILRIILGFLEEWPNWGWSKLHPWADNLARTGSENAYLGFATIMEWVCQNLLRAKAIGPQVLPDPLKTDKLLAMLGHYSLEQWIDICDKLKSHFIAIDASNLDRKQGVTGAFAILSG